MRRDFIHLPSTVHGNLHRLTYQGGGGGGDWKDMVPGRRYSIRNISSLQLVGRFNSTRC
jgi:hypothetical protein